MRPMGQIRPMGIYILALPISPIGRIGLITPISNATKTTKLPQKKSAKGEITPSE